MKHLQKLKHCSQDLLAVHLISKRSFSGFKEISGIHGHPTFSHCIGQEDNIKLTDAPNGTENNMGQDRRRKENSFMNNFENKNNDFDTVYDSQIIDEKLKSCPHLPANRMQKEMFGVYTDAFERTQASQMSNYELICRGQYDGPIRETKEYHYLHVKDPFSNKYNSLFADNGPPCMNYNNIKNKMSHNYDSYYTGKFSTVDINDILSNGNEMGFVQTYDTSMTQTIAKSVDIVDQQYNEYKSKIDQSGKIPNPQSEVNITELSNYDNEMGIKMEMRNDKKWRKHKMRKHRKKKRRREEAQRKIPGGGIRA